MTCELLINQAEFQIFLGVGEEERAQLQPVWVDIKLQFSHEPHACETDNVADTICYFTLIKELQAFIKGKKFQLIEHFFKNSA